MNITIRSWQMEDAADIVPAINNKKILDNLRDGIPCPYTLTDAKDFIALMLNAEKDSQYTWAIAADGKAVGSIGVFRQGNIHNRSAEMGYWIAEPYWGKGVGTAAVKQACDFIFSHTDIIRIFAEPFAFNIPSCRILEKAGFVLEGTLRKNAVKNGVVLDQRMYAIVKA
jgi:RimJ/RimL family protein N-acetyltransferase